MADMTTSASVQTGELTAYRNNKLILQWINVRFNHVLTGAVTDQQFASAMQDTLTLRFARAVTCTPQGIRDIRLNSHG